MLVYNQILNEIVEVLLQLVWVRGGVHEKNKKPEKSKAVFYDFFQLQSNN